MTTAKSINTMYHDYSTIRILHFDNGVVVG